MFASARAARFTPFSGNAMIFDRVRERPDRSNAMKIIDSHVHLYPDKIACKVTDRLGSRFGNEPAFVASVDGCLAKSADSGVWLSLNLPVATSPDQVEHTNDWARSVNAASAGTGPRVVSLASLHPDCDRKAERIASLAREGFAGIKFHPEYQLFRLDDPRMDEVWETMAACGLVAYLHAGGERVFAPPYHSSPRDVAALKKRFPRLTLAAAHLGGFGMWDEAEACLCGEDVYLDLSHVFGWTDDARILRMIRRHGAERILFGTDAPWQDPARVLAAFSALPLDDAAREAILSGNAARLFRVA